MHNEGTEKRFARPPVFAKAFEFENSTEFIKFYRIYVIDPNSLIGCNLNLRLTVKLSCNTNRIYFTHIFLAWHILLFLFRTKIFSFLHENYKYSDLISNYNNYKCYFINFFLLTSATGSWLSQITELNGHVYEIDRFTSKCTNKELELWKLYIYIL